MTAEEKRIDTLDAFRFIAITAVAFYHYYTCWTPPSYSVNLYPYGAKFAGLFHYGYLGVQFFFIISGFVIFYTLERSESFFYFFKRRVSRLFPPMLLCSVVVFLFTLIADPGNAFGFHKSILSFLPSLTFIKPEIWNAVFNTDSFKWVSAVHWSLWYEVQFYLLSSILFFSFRKRFVLAYTCISVLLISSYWVVYSQRLHIYLVTHSTGLATIIKPIVTYLQSAYLFFDLPMQLAYFSIGIFGYLIYTKRKLSNLYYALFTGIIFFQFYIQHTSSERTVYVIILALFILFISNAKVLDFLNTPFVTRIGVISYSLYLIHNEVGVILIAKLATVLPIPSYIIPIIVYGFMILFAELSYRFYERRATAIISKLFDNVHLRITALVRQ